jgi:NAD(P)-dependent dehydrogenase (short-subunit alcohol dehydrogenase family)
MGAAAPSAAPSPESSRGTAHGCSSPGGRAAGSYTKELFGEPLEEAMSGMAQGTLLKRLPTLSEVAETAAFLASSRAGAMTGTVVNLSGGALVD